MVNVFDNEEVTPVTHNQTRQATPQDMVDTIRGLRRHNESLKAELVMAKGPCNNDKCHLHFGHIGPCDTRVDI